jgi:hypothetical protein
MKGPMADMMKAMMGGQDMPDMEEMQSMSHASALSRHKLTNRRDDVANGNGRRRRHAWFGRRNAWSRRCESYGYVKDVRWWPIATIFYAVQCCSNSLRGIGH